LPPACLLAQSSFTFLSSHFNFFTFVISSYFLSSRPPKFPYTPLSKGLSSHTSTATMKFIAPLLALAATVLAQNNAINIPNGGLQVIAGQPLTITWTDPSSSTVTIKLQQGSAVTPDSGIILLSTSLSSQHTTPY
jgi:hypothetical protein